VICGVSCDEDELSQHLCESELSFPHCYLIIIVSLNLDCRQILKCYFYDMGCSIRCAHNSHRLPDFAENGDAPYYYSCQLHQTVPCEGIAKRPGERLLHNSVAGWVRFDIQRPCFREESDLAKLFGRELGNSGFPLVSFSVPRFPFGEASGKRKT